MDKLVKTLGVHAHKYLIFLIIKARIIVMAIYKTSAQYFDTFIFQINRVYFKTLNF